MTYNRKMSRWAMILFCIFAIGVCIFCFACASDDDKREEPTVTVTVTVADGGSGAQADPYLLSLECGGSKQLTVAVNNSDEKPTLGITGECATAELSGDTLTVSAVSVGTARIEISLAEAEVKSYIDVTVKEKPVAEFVLSGLTDGSGVQADPYRVEVAYGKTAEIAYTVRHSDLAPVAQFEGDAITVDIADGKIKITGNAYATTSVKLLLESVSIWLSVTVYEGSAAVSGTVYKYGDRTTIFSGVTVKLSSSDYTAYSMTDDDGAYWFTNLDPDGNYTVALQPRGEYADYVSDRAEKTVESSDFTETQKNLVELDFTMISADEAPRTTVGGVVTENGTPIVGATVEIDGKKAVSDANGAYSVQNVFMFGDVVVTANDRNGEHAQFVRELDLDELVPDGFTECNAELGLPYATYGVVCSNDDCKGYIFKYTRSAQGFEFIVEPVGGRLLGNIELFIDTKESTYERNGSDYLISTDGRLTIATRYVEPSGISCGSPELISVRSATDELGNERLYISVPYAFFKAQGETFAVSPDEVIGVSLGYKVSPVWVGWVDRQSGGGRLFDNKLYIAPEHPVAYMRLRANNDCYRADGNVDVDFDGYKGSFGFGHDRADAFRVNASITADGFKLELMTTGNFGGKGETDEFVCLYLDLDGVKQGGWNFGDGDLTVRLYGDGTVRYKTGAPWWKKNSDGVQTLENAFAVNYENCVTTAVYTLPWSIMGITQQTEFGFALREACDSDADMTLYGVPGEFVYDGVRVEDTASQNGFIRSTALGG